MGSKITDYSCKIGNDILGVSVTRLIGKFFFFKKKKII